MFVDLKHVAIAIKLLPLAFAGCGLGITIELLTKLPKIFNPPQLPATVKPPPGPLQVIGLTLLIAAPMHLIAWLYWRKYRQLRDSQQSVFDGEVSLASAFIIGLALYLLPVLLMLTVF